jgi:uncharacterized protein
MVTLLHKDCNLGIGWRPELAWAIDRREDLGFVELTAEDFDASKPLPPALHRLQERGITLIPHGVSLSLGGTEPLDEKTLKNLARLAEITKAPLVSEHIAYVRAEGLETGHLLPLPRTKVMLEHLITQIRQAQAVLPVPLALENIATLIDWPHPEISEGQFLTEVLTRTDTLLLLDIENVYANARNRKEDPIRFLEQIPLERIAYVHIAGGIEQGGVYHDTHTYPVPKPCLELLEELCARTMVPGVMLERDDNFPNEADFNAELDAIADAIRRGAARREGTHVTV